MIKKILLTAVIVLLVSLPSTLLARGMMHGKWWYDDSVRQELNLSDDEVKTLEEKYTASRRKMIDLKSEVEKQRFELNVLLGAEDIDREKIMERYEILEQARRKLSRERFEMFLGIRETIGAARFQQLKLMHRERYREDKKGDSGKRGYRDRYDD